MKRNAHPIERVLYAVGGTGLMSLAFWGPTRYWILLGLIPSATGFFEGCSPLALFEMSTCERKGNP